MSVHELFMLVITERKSSGLLNSCNLLHKSYLSISVHVITVRIFHSFPQRSWKNTKHLKNLREKCLRFVMRCENNDFSVLSFFF